MLPHPIGLLAGGVVGPKCWRVIFAHFFRRMRKSNGLGLVGGGSFSTEGPWAQPSASSHTLSTPGSRKRPSCNRNPARDAPPENGAEDK